MNNPNISFLDEADLDRMSLAAFCLAKRICPLFGDGDAFILSMEKAAQHPVRAPRIEAIHYLSGIAKESHVVFFQTTLFENLHELLKKNGKIGLLAKLLTEQSDIFAETLTSRLRDRKIGEKRYFDFVNEFNRDIQNYNDNRPFVPYNLTTLSIQAKEVVLSPADTQVFLLESLKEVLAPLFFLVDKNSQFALHETSPPKVYSLSLQSQEIK